MQYIYHSVPQNMIGSKLVPLHQVHEINKKLHAEYLKAYQGREEVLSRRVKLLDCRWNDVLHFLPLHPKKIFKAQKDLGLINQKIPELKFFEINVELLDPKKTIVFFKDAPGEENTDFKWLDEVDIDSLQDVPKATIDYYKSVPQGERPFNYQFVPHILHKGSVDVSNAKIIKL